MTTAKQIDARIPHLATELSCLLQQVPRGRMTTYGRLAKALGDVVASRWVGEHLRDHPHDADCRCHRVVRADGSLGVYINKRAGDKADRLRADGITVIDGRVELGDYLFDSFESDLPLQRLSAWQSKLATSVRIVEPKCQPRWIAGVDVSYGPRRAGCQAQGTAAYVLWDRQSKQLAFRTTITASIRFPYVTTYLAFRELPLLVKVLNAARTQCAQSAEVVMVDGSGVLHPRQLGVAAMLGVLMDLPTIGVTKKKLCGQYDRAGLQVDREVSVDVDGKLCGVALLPTMRTVKPLFISPGHRMDYRMATNVVRTTILDHRLPEPLYWADRLSRQAASW